VEDSVGSVVVGCGVGSGAVSAEDSKARVLVVISLKTYTQTTPALTNSRPAGYEWMVILALPPVPPHSSVAVVVSAVASMQSLANK